jgi:uncharacterized protein YjbK
MDAPTFEVEVRSFIPEHQYHLLKKQFDAEAQFISEQDQETFYFDAAQDARLQLNTQDAKIWLKGGQIHDD